MKYSCVVLVNNKNPYGAVDFLTVTDAFLAAGVFLGETCVLPYDAPSAANETLSRLSADSDGVFIICDDVLLPTARELVRTASGADFTEDFLLETESTLFGVLPAGERGAALVKTETSPRIDARRKQSYRRMVMRGIAIPEETLSAALGKANGVGGGAFALHATETFGDVKVELIYDKLTPKMVADDAVYLLAKELDDYLYAVDDVTLPERLVELLKVRRMHISCAESFTGGGVGRAIVGVPGASEVFFESVNAYNEQAKTERLGVTKETLERNGAVSDETVYAMAAGLLRAGNCDVAVATTGYAGPETENGAPVGLCYIAAGTRKEIHIYRYVLPGDRERITETAINLALFAAYREIK